MGHQVIRNGSDTVLCRRAGISHAIADPICTSQEKQPAWSMAGKSTGHHHRRLVIPYGLSACPVGHSDSPVELCSSGAGDFHVDWHLYRRECTQGSSEAIASHWGHNHVV